MPHDPIDERARNRQACQGDAIHGERERAIVVGAAKARPRLEHWAEARHPHLGYAVAKPDGHAWPTGCPPRSLADPLR